jgi:hypothetical protein
MPEHASRFAAALYDQFEEEHRVADWGGDELFTRMPRPRAVDDAPPPRFRRSQPAAERPLALVDSPAERRGAPDGEGRSEPRERRAPSAEQTMRERAERLSLAVVADAPAAPAPAADPRAADPAAPPAAAPPAGRPTKLITGRPDGTPRLPAEFTSSVERRRPARTPAEWVGARPERIVAWAFALGLLLILIAISTADAATV